MKEIIFLLALASANSGIALRVVEPMLPKLASDFGESVSFTAMIITAYAFSYGASQLLHGPFGDRFGKLRVVTFTLMAAGLGSFGCALAWDISSLATMRLVTGFFASTPVMLGMAYIGDHVPLAERQPVIARFISGTIIGQALGPAIGGAVTDLLGWRGTFALLGAVFATVSLVLFVRTHSQWAEDKGKKFSGNPFAVHGRLLGSARVRLLLAVAFIEAAIFFGAFSFLGAYLKHRFDLSLTLIGVMLAGFGIGGVLYTILVRRLLMEFGQRGLAIWGGVLCFVCYLFTALTPVWYPVLAFTIGLGFSFYMLHNTVQTKATEMAPEARGTSVAMYTACWALGQSAGVAGMGLAVGVLDYALPIILFGAAYFALGVWMRKNLDRL